LLYSPESKRGKKKKRGGMRERERKGEQAVGTSSLVSWSFNTFPKGQSRTFQVTSRNALRRAGLENF
jgi:hypothetical protein